MAAVGFAALCVFSWFVLPGILKNADLPQPTPPEVIQEAKDKQAAIDKRKQEALAQGNFITADDLPSIAARIGEQKPIPQNTFLVGTFASDGGQSGGEPSMTAPISGPSHIIHMWVRFHGVMDVTKLKRGQTWTWTKDAPLRVIQVTMQRDGRIDVRASEAILP